MYYIIYIINTYILYYIYLIIYYILNTLHVLQNICLNINT